MKKLFLIAFSFVLFISYSAQAKGPCDTPQMQEAINKLDKMSAYFSNLQCKPDDAQCWWYTFHLAIGDTGPASMTRFAQKVPYKNFDKLGYGSFKGEAHVAQYPGYWLLKGVNTNTKLRSGSTLNEYIKNTPWSKVYTDTVKKINPVNINEELSWYWITRSFYPQLKKLEQTTHFEDSCGGGHHITGMYYNNTPESKNELKGFMKKINGLVLSDTVPPEYKNYPYVDLYRFYVLSHAFESLYFTRNENLVSPKLVQKAVEHTNLMYGYFQNGKAQYADPENFFEKIRSEGYAIYYYGDTLGHFRYGLKICAGVDDFRKSIK